MAATPSDLELSRVVRELIGSYLVGRTLEEKADFWNSALLPGLTGMLSQQYGFAVTRQLLENAIQLVDLMEADQTPRGLH